MMVFLCWIFLNERFGLGIIAIGGAFLYMSMGLVDWKDVSKHTNWGVILLFAGAISLGVQMKNTGAALWIGNALVVQFSSLIEQFTIIPEVTVIIRIVLTGTRNAGEDNDSYFDDISLNIFTSPFCKGSFFIKTING